MVDALLRFAGKLGADELRQLLLMPNHYGETCLHVSASRGHLHIVQALLGAGGREFAMTTDDFGTSCLNTAAMGRHLHIMQALLQAHPELLTLETASRRSCLYTSAQNGDLEIVRALLQTGGHALAMTTDNFEESCLCAAARQGHLEIVRALLRPTPAENSIDVLRTSAKAMMLAGNIPKRYWQFVVSHAAYLTRDHITFDPQVFPFKLKPASSPDWQTFYNLTNPVAEGAVLHKSPSATLVLSATDRTRISWSVSILARFTTKAGAPHMALVKKVLRYLQGRKRIPLRWCARSCQQPHLPGHI